MCVLCVCESWYIGVGVCVMRLCVFECTTCVCVRVGACEFVCVYEMHVDVCFVLCKYV